MNFVHPNSSPSNYSNLDGEFFGDFVKPPLFEQK